jgi:hypothetical protein
MMSSSVRVVSKRFEFGPLYYMGLEIILFVLEELYDEPVACSVFSAGGRQHDRRNVGDNLPGCNVTCQKIVRVT